MHALSVTIITKNEALNIERCLQSVRWADEVVVVDSGSTDETLQICRRFDCRVMETEWRGFGRTKQLAVGAASNEWILSVDADEVVTPQLRDRITELLQGEPAYSVYRIRRQSHYLGKRIRNCGWDRDYPRRFFNKTQARFNDAEVHESIQYDGPKGTLEEPLLHYPYPDVATHLRKMNLYSDLAAQIAYEKGKSASIPYAVMAGILKFIKMYIGQCGFLDGRAGLVLSLNSANGVYLKYIKLWQKNH